MGAAEDPDIDDYYDKSREFSLTYSPEEDPEVIEEMRVAGSQRLNWKEEKIIARAKMTVMMRA
jgi:hypothetical protein